MLMGFFPDSSGVPDANIDILKNQMVKECQTLVPKCNKNHLSEKTGFTDWISALMIINYS